MYCSAAFTQLAYILCFWCSVSATCKRHEDCDVLKAVEGKCGENARCETGRSDIGVSYFAPKECSLTPEDGKSLFSYCGRVKTKDGGVVYTGKCTAFDYNGHTHGACRAFENKEEILKTVSAELDHRASQLTDPLNDVAITAWYLLEPCPMENTAVVGGKRVCLHTTQTIQADRIVSARSADDALSSCSTDTCQTHGDCPVGLCVRGKNGACSPVANTQTIVDHAPMTTGKLDDVMPPAIAVESPAEAKETSLVAPRDSPSESLSADLPEEPLGISFEEASMP